MTTFTTDDRKSAYDPGLTCVTPSSANGMEEPNLVAEAPYHPGYEDAVIVKGKNPIIDELNEFRRMNEKYKAMQHTIVEFIKESNKTKK